VDKAIAAVKTFRPVTEAESEELKRIAGTTDSIFTREEASVARGGVRPPRPYHEHPHECEDSHWG
jgi:hypothetical protein